MVLESLAVTVKSWVCFPTATQTGGGPPAKKLSNETEKIVDMMKDCSSFVGFQGCESSINLTEGAYIIIDISNILKRPADFCLH